MIGFLKYASLALVAVSSVSGLVIPRKTPPKGYDTKNLEAYDTYHLRYLSIGCKTQHGKPFFDQCCHPFKKGASIPKKCQPSASQLKSGKAQVAAEGKTSKSADDGGDNGGNNGGSSGSTSGLITGGHATFYNQDGTAGACGKKHSDNDLVVAMQVGRYGNPDSVSPLCGKHVEITNTKNGKTVTCLVADACPSCQGNKNSIDMSRAAFRKIATDVEGEVPIAWKFV